MRKKVPQDISDEIMFLENHTCAICCTPHKPVQLKDGRGQCRDNAVIFSTPHIMRGTRGTIVFSKNRRGQCRDNAVIP